MKYYIGKADAASEVMAAAGDSARGPIIAASVDVADVAEFVGIGAPPPDVTHIFTLFAPEEGADEPEGWRWTDSGRGWYTRDLCAALA